MTFKQFKEIGFDLTEKEAFNFEKRIISAYNQALKDIENAIKNQYAKYLAGIPKENYYNEMLKHNRLEKLYLEIAGRYSKAANLSKTAIIDGSKIAITNNFYRQSYANMWISEYSFSLLPESIVELSVMGSRKAWKEILKKGIDKGFGNPAMYKPQYGTLTDLLLNHKRQELNRIQAVIEQGLLQGQGVQTVGRNLREFIGFYRTVDGNIEASGVIAKAIRISRTEINRAANDASYAAQKSAEAQGIDIKKQWSATLDMRTRPIHGQLDGQIRDIDAKFEKGGFRVMRPGAFGVASQDINCRCTTIDIIDDQSPSIRRGLNPTTGESEVFKYKDFDTWANDNGLKYDTKGRLVKA